MRGDGTSSEDRLGRGSFHVVTLVGTLVAVRMKEGIEVGLKLRKTLQSCGSGCEGVRRAAYDGTVRGSCCSGDGRPEWCFVRYL